MILTSSASSQTAKHVTRPFAASGSVSACVSAHETLTKTPRGYVNTSIIVTKLWKSSVASACVPLSFNFDARDVSIVATAVPRRIERSMNDDDH